MLTQRRAKDDAIKQGGTIGYEYSLTKAFQYVQPRKQRPGSNQ